jgi:hypothetical protein
MTVERKMTDEEITRLSAEAMGYEIVGFETKNGGIMARSKTHHLIWNPLNDDEHAMALIKQFPVTCIDALDNLIGWGPEKDEDNRELDLNTEVVMAVARMQLERATDK